MKYQDLDNDSTITEESLLELLEKSNKTRIYDLEESIFIAVNVEKSAIKHQFFEIVAKAQNQLGLYFMIKGEYENAVKYSEKALAFFTQVNNIKGTADATYNIASTLYKSDNFQDGLIKLIECLHYFRLLDDAASESRVLKAMGTIYEYYGDFDKASELYQLSIEAARRGKDINLETNVYNPLSGILLKKEKYDEALTLAEKSVYLKMTSGDNRGLGFSIYARGKVFLKTKKYDKALADFFTSLSIHREHGDKLGEGMTLVKIGETYTKSGDIENALKFHLLANELGENAKVKLITYKSYFNLYLYYKASNDYETALDYYEKYIGQRDTTINSHTYSLVKNYEAAQRIERLESEAKSQIEYNKIIEEKNNELDSFFYRISHDLKGPIASILGLQQLVKHENFSVEAMAYFNMYHEQFSRINMIVTDLINLTELNNYHESKSLIDFKALVNSCIGSLSYLENYNRVKFIINIEKKMHFISERVIINAILQNLIENAVKYMKPDIEGVVNINIKKEESSLLISIQDNGLGIPEKYHEKIFSMFFRATNKSQGTGLGLYILKRAVERIKGTVTLQSEEGVGSCFMVNVPY